MSRQILPCVRRKKGGVCGCCGSKPRGRARAIAKLDNWATEHGLPPEPFARMKQAVAALFAGMELRGELDSSSPASVT
jgi:hypothetical protein